MRFNRDSLFGISPPERRNVALAFCYGFSTAGAYVVGRSAADALFLARIGSDWLPLMYLLSACTVGLLAVVFLYFATGRSLKQIVLLTLLLLASSSLVLCQLVQKFDHALVLLIAIYLLAEVCGCLNTIQYGILMNELFAGTSDHHQAAGLLGAASTLAGIVFGTFVAFEVYQVGTVYLLYVVAGLQVCAMLPIAMLPRIDLAGDAGRLSGDEVAGLSAECNLESLPFESYTSVFATGFTKAARSSYVRGIGVLVAVAVVVGTLVEFQWKSSVASSFLGKEDQMASFFGVFHAAVNLMTGSLQILVTGRILQRFGARTALLVFPATLLAGTLGVLLASFDRVVLSAISLAKGCDVFKRSINDPSIWMLYAPINDGPRRQAITFVTGIVKPSAEAFAGLLIIMLTGIVSERAISYVAMVLLCVWVIVAMRRRTSQPHADSPSEQNTSQGPPP